MIRRFFDWIMGRGRTKDAHVLPKIDLAATALSAFGRTSEQAAAAFCRVARLLRGAQWSEYHTAGCPYGEDRGGLERWWKENRPWDP